jgi:adenylyltransferase/sulfurtransferase
MPLSDFIECTKHLLERPDQALVIYCHHGVRSLHATHWLRQQGMHSVFSLEGGIHRWALEIDSSVPLY